MTIVDDEDGDSPYIEGSELTVIGTYRRYTEGRDPAQIAEDYGVHIARIHEAIAYYYDNAERMMRLDSDSEDSSTDGEEEDDSKIYWHSVILDHERRIQLVLFRLDDDGSITDNLGGLNIHFDDESTYDEAVIAFVDWLERCCDYFDFYQDMRDDFTDSGDTESENADRGESVGEETIRRARDLRQELDRDGLRDRIEELDKDMESYREEYGHDSPEEADQFGDIADEDVNEWAMTRADKAVAKLALRLVEAEPVVMESATAGRDDWEGTTPSDAGEALFGDGPDEDDE